MHMEGSEQPVLPPGARRSTLALPSGASLPTLARLGEWSLLASAGAEDGQEPCALLVLTSGQETEFCVCQQTPAFQGAERRPAVCQTCRGMTSSTDGWSEADLAWPAPVQ